MTKSADAFRTISEVADDLGLPQHVLRFWETRFPQIKPLKRAGGRRFYRPADVVLIARIQQLLYGEGYTIKGVQRLLKEHGIRALVATQPSVSSEKPAPDDLMPTDTRVLETIPHEDLQIFMTPDPRDADALQALLDLIEECEAIIATARSVP